MRNRMALVPVEAPRLFSGMAEITLHSLLSLDRTD